jgi:hypothetical protein
VIGPDLVHCPVCSTEYPSGTSICMNDSSILVDGPAAGGADADDGSDGGDERTGDLDDQDGRIGRLEVVAMDEGPDAPSDLFASEERPRRILLAVMVPEDAPDLIERLEDEGIGARLGEPTDDGGVEVLIHEQNVQEAQAILVDFTGDPSLADDIGALPGDDGYELVSRGVDGAMVNVERLRDAGIDVRLELGEEGLTQPWAIHCPSEDVERARALLGVLR